MFSGVDEKSHKVSQMRRRIQDGQPHPTQKGSGIYSYSMNEFARLLISYIFKERELETIKVNIIKRADFNLIDLYKLLDWRC